MKTTLSRLATVLLLMLGCSGGGDSGVEPVNNAPTISLLFTKLGVVRAIPVNIEVAVDDLDGDPLTINWSISRSTLTPQNPAQTIARWATPATVGTDTLTVRVSDGQASNTITALIKVGYAANGQLALPIYEKAKSPYIVAPPASDPILSVAEGTTTVLEPGVELLIDTPGTVIDVAGSLTSNGTGADPVVIQPNNRTFRCGDERGWWEGIRGSTVSDGTNTFDGFVDLRYTEIRYGNRAVRVRDSSRAVLRNCMLRCSGEAGVLIEGYGSLRVEDSEVSNGRADGVVIAAIAALPDSVLVRGCEIAINAASGCRMDLNDTGKTVPIIVEYNKFEFNYTRGITLVHAVFPKIHFNHFTGNGVGTAITNIFLESGFPVGTTAPELDATCNFWGAAFTNPATIEGTIRDSRQSGSVHTMVIVDPWLNASPLTTPPSCTPPSS